MRQEVQVRGLGQAARRTDAVAERLRALNICSQRGSLRWYGAYLADDHGDCDAHAPDAIERRIRDAHLPRMKTLEEFDYTQSPNVTAAKMRDLAEGGYRSG
jgi:hypothetical protein